MARDVEMLGVLVDPAQKQKVRRWAEAMKADMSTAIRSLIDAVDLEIQPSEGDSQEGNKVTWNKQ
jgi:predicted transcriptional regulator